MEIIRVELTKLVKGRSLKVFGILYGVVLLAITTFYILGENMIGLSLYNDTQFVGISLNVVMGFILPLMTIYLITTGIGNDFRMGTIKNMFLLPISKMKIYYGKLVAVQILVGVILAGQFIFTYLVSMIQDGGVSLSSFGVYFMDYVGAFFILGLVNLIGANLGLLFNSSGLAIVFAYIGYIGLGFLNIYLPQFASVSIPTLITNYKEVISVNGMTLLFSLMSYYIILSITGYLLFEKKEESLCQFD